MEIFPDTQGQVTWQSVAVSGRILNSFGDFMVVVVTCKNVKDSFKNEGAKVATRLYVDFSDAQRQIIH